MEQKPVSKKEVWVKHITTQQKLQIPASGYYAQNSLNAKSLLPQRFNFYF